jgi:uncharacterized protein HemY
LISVAQAAGKLADPAQGRQLLDGVVSTADRGRGEAELAALFLTSAETAAKLGEPAQARTLLSRAAQETAGIRAESAKAHAEVALAETALQVGERSQAQASLKALGAMRESSGAKVVADPDLVRAVTVAASLDQWQWATSMVDTLNTDNAKLDALSRIFAVWQRQSGNR